ncbi:MAG: rRNA pseudouridine synthase [Epsilonproteobacteria bacterium]|nr:rRNA pseudouridine synthase [Campylobacterota bacterium]
MKKEELIRLNKFISHNSRFSRREADKLIEDGKVEINNKVVIDLSTKVTDDVIVKVNGRTVKVDKSRPSTVIVYNKQKGEIVSKKDPQGRTTIYDTLPSKYSHFLPIGRLDFASEGVLLLTDDVEIANVLMHSNLERIYKLKIAGSITPAMEAAMQNGITLDDASKGAHKYSTITSMEFSPFNGYQIQKNGENFSTMKVSISEGKNRELRRFFGYFDTPIVDLKRIDYGGITLNNLPSGKIRFLERKEYQNLRTYMKDIKKELSGEDGKSY